MIFQTFPHKYTLRTINDVNMSIHAYNGSGDNEIVLSQGNIDDMDKAAPIETVTVTEGLGKVIAIIGHQTKYLFMEITGDGVLEMDIHAKRTPN